METAGVMNFTFLESDDLIASAEIPISELVEGRDEENGVWFPVEWEGSECGKFLIVFKYGAEDEPAVPTDEAEAAPEAEEAPAEPEAPAAPVAAPMMQPTPGMQQPMAQPMM